MKFDLHTHHERCGHALGTIPHYIEAAIEKGLSIIGISDHTPYFAVEEDQPQPNIAMAKSDFAHYVDEVLQLKEKYRDKIEVLLGIESDFFIEHSQIYQNILNKYPFDYIIGSVHRINDISIFNKNRWKGLAENRMIQEKEAYYEMIQHSARSGTFQILGHIDAMKGYYPAFSDIPTKMVDETLKVIAESDVSIEINTSGKTKDCGGWYPSNEILERALHYGVHVTFGSDAHDPSRVGDEWVKVSRTLKDIGYREWVFYRQKEKQAVPID